MSDIETRAKLFANYIIENRATVRATAKAFDISKSTVHKDVAERLKKFNPSLAEEAKKVLEINMNHPIANKLKDLYENDKEELKSYAKVLYAEARLIEGLSIENPTDISNLINSIISK